MCGNLHLSEWRMTLRCEQVQLTFIEICSMDDSRRWETCKKKSPLCERSLRPGSNCSLTAVFGNKQYPNQNGAPPPQYMINGYGLSSNSLPLVSTGTCSFGCHQAGFISLLTLDPAAAFFFFAPGRTPQVSANVWTRSQPIASCTLNYTGKCNILS